MSIARKGIIIDACCLINLYASSVFERILKNMNADFYIAEYIKEDEALKIKNVQSQPDKYISIDLEPYIKKGLIEVIKVEDKEVPTFVNFAAMVDDGEAKCGSLAVHRNLIIATDDKAAISLFSNHNPPITTISTIQLLKKWVEIEGIDPNILSTVIENIETRASYKPSSKHKDYNWWEDHR